jgi:L-ascorbate metabolism protein UlaG (beta-lactamase superfamily)
MLDIGGMRVYLSGDTDLYGDMKTLGARYQPNLAIVCVGDGPFTMGPEDAARACQWMGVSHAIPVHCAHNPLVRGFRRAMAQIKKGLSSSVPIAAWEKGDVKSVKCRRESNTKEETG